MKIKLYKILGLFLVLSIFTTSCESWIDPDMNDDPNALTDVTMKSVLANTQLSFFFVVGDADWTGYTAAWTQHLRGADRQFSAVDKYSITPTDLNNLWSGMYEDNLEGLQLIKEKAEEQSSPHYSGVAKVMEAASLELLTMYFGDLAYSDAFQGEKGNFQPEYDSQEEIFTQIQTLLDDAITELQTEKNEIPLQGDMIFNGDTEKWLKVAYSLRARVNMHFTKRANVSYSDVISDLNNGISSNANDFQLFFPDDIARANPMHQFLQERDSYLDDNDFFQNYIAGDPRASVLYYRPRTVGADESGFWFQPDSPVAILENAEMLYLKAEAQIRDDDATSARATLKDAIEASLNKYGVMDQGWFNGKKQEIDATGDGDLLEMIMEEKYIHMFGNPVVFYCDFRRTGYPAALQPTSGDRFPERFPYPSDEISYNTNTPDYGSVFNTLWIFNEG